MPNRYTSVSTEPSRTRRAISASKYCIPLDRPDFIVSRSKDPLWSAVSRQVITFESTLRISNTARRLLAFFDGSRRCEIMKRNALARRIRMAGCSCAGNEDTSLSTLFVTSTLFKPWIAPNARSRRLQVQSPWCRGHEVRRPGSLWALGAKLPAAPEKNWTRHYATRVDAPCCTCGYEEIQWDLQS